MRRFQTHYGIGFFANPRIAVVVSVLCLALLALLSAAQVAHIHPFASDADHCPICIVLHAVAPLSVAAVIILLVQIGASAPVAEARKANRPWSISLYTRPPPFSC